MAAAAIAITCLSKVFQREGGGETHIALQNLDLLVYEGEFFCLLGPSGCGKTTLLNLIAGFERPTSGKLEVFGRAVSGPGPDRGAVFQSDLALFSWLTVEENIEFGLKVRHVPKPERRHVVELNLELVGLTRFRKRFPHELSGGMKQRVQIARVLANDLPRPRGGAMTEQFLELHNRLSAEIEAETPFG